MGQLVIHDTKENLLKAEKVLQKNGYADVKWNNTYRKDNTYTYLVAYAKQMNYDYHNRDCGEPNLLNLKQLVKHFKTKIMIPKLETGMRAEYRNGTITFVRIMDNKNYFIDGNDKYTSSQDDNLESWHDNQYDIMRIWDIPRAFNSFFNIGAKGKLLWECKEEVTIKLEKGRYSLTTLKSLIEEAEEN